ncbi:hypothetical protein K432DRAFT_307791, partial [Lepidopterella palustris CBS 459.81]
MHIPLVQRHICDAVKQQNNIANLSLADQWHRLVLGPLSKLESSQTTSSYVIVIDALDECEGERDVRVILQLSAESRSLHAVKLRILITSRPEIPIQYGFYQIPMAKHHDFVLHNIEAAVVDGDIFLFLKCHLGVIGQQFGHGAGWPGEEISRRLVWRAGGLFIWAATACRFVSDGRQFAAKRLEMILGGRGSTSAPEQYLNELYTTVLRNSIHQDWMEEEKEEMYSKLQYILGSIVVLLSPLSTVSLSKLLHLSGNQVDQTLQDLQAILDIPKDPNISIRLHHPSFRDFLLDANRCRDAHFLVHESQAHNLLAAECIQLMSNALRRDICGVNAPGTLATELEQGHLQRCITPELQYACLYWVEHLVKGGSRLSDNNQVDCFLQEHLLHWCEALGWMERMQEGIVAIATLESLAAVSNYTFVHDAKRFMMYNRSTVELAPLQVYSSALMFSPEKSVVRQKFQDCIPCSVRMISQADSNWRSLLQTLEGHSGWVSAVAFSPDGSQLASAS